MALGWEDPLGFDQDRPVDRVKGADDFAGLFQHWFLVVTDWDQFGLKGGDVGGLADRVGQEAGRNRVVEVLLLDFTLDGRVAFQAGNGHQV